MAEQKIAGRVFRVQKPLATEALALQFRVANLIEGSKADLPAALSALEKAAAPSASDAVKAEAGQTVITMLMGLLGSTDPDKGAAFISDVVAMAEIQGQNGDYEKCDLDTIFSTEPDGLYQLVGFVLKEVIGPFISGLLGSLGGRKGKAA